MSQLWLCLFPSSEHHGYLDFIPLCQKPFHMADLKSVVVNADLGPEFDLFHLDLRMDLSGRSPGLFPPC